MQLCWLNPDMDSAGGVADRPGVTLCWQKLSLPLPAVDRQQQGRGR